MSCNHIFLKIKSNAELNILLSSAWFMTIDNSYYAQWNIESEQMIYINMWIEKMF